MNMQPHIKAEHEIIARVIRSSPTIRGYRRRTGPKEKVLDFDCYDGDRAICCYGEAKDVTMRFGGGPIGGYAFPLIKVKAAERLWHQTGLVTFAWIRFGQQLMQADLLDAIDWSIAPFWFGDPGGRGEVNVLIRWRQFREVP